MFFEHARDRTTHPATLINVESQLNTVQTRCTWCHLPSGSMFPSSPSTSASQLARLCDFARRGSRKTTWASLGWSATVGCVASAVFHIMLPRGPISGPWQFVAISADLILASMVVVSIHLTRVLLKAFQGATLLRPATEVVKVDKIARAGIVFVIVGTICSSAATTSTNQIRYQSISIFASGIAISLLMPPVASFGIKLHNSVVENIASLRKHISSRAGSTECTTKQPQQRNQSHRIVIREERDSHNPSRIMASTTPTANYLMALTPLANESGGYPSRAKPKGRVSPIVLRRCRRMLRSNELEPQGSTRTNAGVVSGHKWSSFDSFTAMRARISANFSEREEEEEEEEEASGVFSAHNPEDGENDACVDLKDEKGEGGRDSRCATDTTCPVDQGGREGLERKRKQTSRSITTLSPRVVSKMGSNTSLFNFIAPFVGGDGGSSGGGDMTGGVATDNSISSPATVHSVQAAAVGGGGGGGGGGMGGYNKYIGIKRKEIERLEAVAKKLKVTISGFLTLGALSVVGAFGRGLVIIMREENKYSDVINEVYGSQNQGFPGRPFFGAYVVLWTDTLITAAAALVRAYSGNTRILGIAAHRWSIGSLELYLRGGNNVSSRFRQVDRFKMAIATSLLVHV
eukprot:jgi/Bigna1/81084/fgenesh1_pg.77_\